MTHVHHTIVGLFVLCGLLCVGYLTIKLGKMEVLDQKGMSLTAQFNSVSGLRVGAAVELAGVPIGRVAAIGLTTSDAMVTMATVRLQITEPIALSDDTIASIRTSGLIGDKYVSISPGSSDTILQDGGIISETEGAVDLESLLSKYAFGGVDK